MKKPIFVNDQIYHIYNRGVEKREIFLDNQDRFRFVHDLFEFNDEAPAANIYYKLPALQSYERSHEVQLRKIGRRKRKCVTEILAFCLMSNHFHLLLRQKVDKGIVNFMQKLGTGYTNYFNKKYQRVGSLFQGRFKATLVENNSHFTYLPYYIHSNPLDIVMPQWREQGINDYQKALKFLESYRWSSFLDYIDKKNFPSVTQREFLCEFWEGPTQHKKDMMQWLKNTNLEEIRKVILE